MLELCGHLGESWGGGLASGEERGEGTKLAPSPKSPPAAVQNCSEEEMGRNSTRGGGSGLTICVSVSLLRLVSFIIGPSGVFALAGQLLPRGQNWHFRSIFRMNGNYKREGGGLLKWQLQGLVAQQMNSHQLVLDAPTRTPLFMMLHTPFLLSRCRHVFKEVFR